MNSGNQISFEDFLIYWKWLTGSRGNDTFVKRVEAEKVVRVFTTLNMFDNEEDLMTFMKCWSFQRNNTVTFDELQEGMAMLSSNCNEKFSRFMHALRIKSERDKTKEIERNQEIEKQLRKEEQKEKIMEERRQKNKKEPPRLSPHPPLRCSQRQKSLEPSTSREQTQKSSVIGRVLKFLSSLSSSSSSVGSAKIADKSGNDSGHICACSAPEAELPNLLVRHESTDSEEGFTYRLNSANLAVIQQEISSGRSLLSGNIAMHRIDSIDESLVSFGVASEAE